MAWVGTRLARGWHGVGMGWHAVGMALARGWHGVGMGWHAVGMRLAWGWHGVAWGGMGWLCILMCPALHRRRRSTKRWGVVGSHAGNLKLPLCLLRGSLKS